MNEAPKCYITHIEVVGRLFKVWVQHNSEVAIEIERATASLKEKLEYSEGPTSVEQFSRNGIYFARYSGDLGEHSDFYRCFVIGRCNTAPNKVNVAFIDHGNTHPVSLSDIRLITPEMKSQYPILTCPGQATNYYLCAVCVKHCGLADRELSWLKAKTLNSEFRYSLSEGSFGVRMISILLDHNGFLDMELSNLLVQKNLGQMISIDELCAMAKDVMHYQPGIPYTSMPVTSPVQSICQKFPVPVSSKIDVVSSQSVSARKPSMPIYQPPHVYQQNMNQPQMNLVQQARFIPKDKLVGGMPFPAQNTVKKTFDNTISVGSTYQMYVSNVEDGPLEFSLQLKQYADEVLPYLSVQLNKLVLQKFTSALTIGMVVIGMHSPDKTLRRAMIITAGSTSCRVYYVDLGSSENLQHSNIFQLPTSLNITQIPAVAISFALKGMDPKQATEVVKSGFKDLVMSKVVFAKVMTEAPVRTCDLFVDGRDVRTLMAHFNQPLQFLRQFPPRDKDTVVVVSYVEGPQQIFVQYKSEAATLAVIEETLNSASSLQKEIINVNDLTIGKPVLSNYSSDNRWYRAQVMEVGSNQTITVLYVDYGNKEYVNSNTIRDISQDLVSKWRCQAVECCLVGFDCILPSETLAEKLEEKILSSELTLKVHSLLSADRLLVDLIDSSGASVAAYLSDIHNAIVAESQKNAVTETSYALSDASVPTYSVSETKSTHDYSYEEPKSSRSTKDSYAKSKTKDSYEDFSYRSTKDEDSYTKSRTKDPYAKSKTKDSNEDFSYRSSKDEDSYGKSKTKDSYAKLKTKDSNEDFSYRSTKDEDSYAKSKTKDSYDDFSYKKKPTDNRKMYDSKDQDYSASGNKWKPKDSQDHHSGNKWKLKDSFDDSSGNRWKTKDSQDDQPKANRFRGGGDFSDRKSDRFDNKFKGKDDKWGKDDGKWRSGKMDRDDTKGSKWNKEERFHIGEKKNKDAGIGGSRKWEDDGRKGRGEFKYDSKLSDDYKKTPQTLYSDRAPEKDKFQYREEPAPATDVKFNPKVKEYIGWNLEGKTSTVVVLSHIDSPDRFFVRPLDAETELDRLRDMIDSDAGATSRVIPARVITVGTPVLAVYSEDKCLYRAVIEKVNFNTAEVLFIDYGNTTQVPFAELYYPTDNLARLPMTVIHCCLMNAKPQGGSWTSDTNALIDCFGKESHLNMTIESIKLIDGLPVHNVSLIVADSGKSVAQNLVDAGFAKSSSVKGSTPSLQNQESVEPASSLSLPLTEESINQEEVWVERLELLVGQFLLSRVLSIISPEAVIVKLDATNLLVICTSPDLDTSIQIGEKVIIQVNCILEDRLRVTVYDKGGYVAGDTKRELSQVSPVCSMPIIRSHFKVTVSHCEQMFVYVQKTSDSDRISEMLDSLYAYYEGTKPSGKEYAINSLCACKSVDENWYRARIIKRINDLYTIRFIDYGNIEDIDSSQIRKLDNQFFYPEMSIKGELDLKWKVPVDKIDLAKYVEGKEFTANFVKKNSQNWFIKLEDNDRKNVSSQLIELGQGDMYKETPFCEVNSVIGSEILAGDKIPVTVTHVESPQLFWVQMVKHIQTVESIQEKLQTVECKKDNNCAIFGAKYSADHLWYRALGIDPDNPNLVRFIDYGNTDTVTERKELTHALTKPTSGYAVKMCLCAVPKNGSTWSQDALIMFEEFIDADQVVAEIVSVSNKIITDLTVNGKSISNLLIESGHAVYEDFTPSLIKNFLSINEAQSMNVFVCHILSVNDFYILDKNRETKLEELSTKLSKSENYPPVSNPKLGNLIVAKFPEDEAWYRGIITKVEPLTVLFIDFGNSSIVDEIGRVPDSVKDIPPFAVHCSLGFDFESDLALDKFIELSEEGKNVFNLSIIKKGDRNMVKMTLNESDIVDLLPKVQSNPILIDGQIGYISHFNSFDDFYIQLKDDLKLDNVVDELSEAENFSEVEKNLSVGSLIAAQYPEDNEWYRAKVVSIEPLTVIFYDYGNTSEVVNVKELPPDLKLIPATSYRCCMEKPLTIQEWTETLVDSFLELSQDCLTPFNIKIVKLGNPIVVQLTTENQQDVIQAIIGSTISLHSKEVSLPANSNTKKINVVKNPSQKNNINNKFATISHFVSVDDLYIVLTEDSNLETEINKSMALVETFEEYVDYSIDDIIVAPLPEVALWRRAKVISTNPLRVYFIDDGVVDVIPKAKKIPSEMQLDVIKPLAIHCALKKPLGLDSWPDNIVELEDSLTLMTDKLKVKVHSEGDPTFVSLFLNDKDIISEFGESCVTSHDEITDSCDYDNKPVVIPYGESLSSFYIQKEEDYYRIESVQQQLVLSYKLNDIKSPTVGSLVSAICPEDEIWYRARVISTTPELEVTFIDYGNSSIVPSVKDLPDNLKNIPPFVLHCSLKLPCGLKSWTPEAESIFSKLLFDNETVYTVKMEESGTPSVVSLIKQGENLCKLLVKEVTTNNPGNDSKVSNPNPSSLDMNNKLAIVSHVNKLDEFYIQLLDDADKINDLIEKLLMGDSFAEINNVTEGSLVAAQFVDMQWHRAVIIGILENEYEVFFIDYGNTSSIKDIRDLPKELKDIPPLAYKMMLKKPEGIPAWTDEMEKQFVLFNQMNTQPFVVLTQPSGCISLMLNDVNIYNKFTSLSLDKTSSALVFVTYCESPASFYVQYNNSPEIQKKVFDSLKDVKNLPTVKDLKEGDLVCAKYPHSEVDVEVWCRSKVLSVSPEINVSLVDFGDTMTVDEVKVLPDELKEIEPLAKHCCLVAPRCGSGWSNEASSYFMVMISSPVNISIIEDGDPATVDLFINGNSVTSDLLELCPLIDRPVESAQNDDIDIDEEDVMREEAIFNAEQASNNAENNGNHNGSQILCNGISDLKIIDEESDRDSQEDKHSEVNQQDGCLSEESTDKSYRPLDTEEKKLDKDLVNVKEESVDERSKSETDDKIDCEKSDLSDEEQEDTADSAETSDKPKQSESVEGIESVTEHVKKITLVDDSEKVESMNDNMENSETSHEDPDKTSKPDTDKTNCENRIENSNVEIQPEKSCIQTDETDPNQNDDEHSSSSDGSNNFEDAPETSVESTTKPDFSTSKAAAFDEKLIPGVVSRGEIHPEQNPPKTPTEDKIIPGCVQGNVPLGK